MVVLRATQKVLKMLSRSAADTDTSDTALGDWYANRIVIDRQPLLLLVSSKSRVAVLAPARDVKGLPKRLAEMVAERLRRLGVDEDLIRAEVNAMNVVRVGRTTNRSITGHMVDFAKLIPYYLPIEGWDESHLRLAEHRLSETPCRASRPDSEVIFPDRVTARLLAQRWRRNGTVHSGTA